MNLALTVLEITAPVFILVMIGFVWVKMGFEYRVEFVTRLAMTICALLDLCCFDANRN